MSTNTADQGNRISDWFKKKNFGNQTIAALKTGLAAVLCVWLGNLIGLQRSYWAAVSAVVVMGVDNTITFASCRDRIIGTAIGAFMGWVTFYVWHGHYLIYGLSVALCLFVCSALAYDKAGRLAAVTLSIVVLIKWDGGPAQAAIARFLEVGFGIIVALVVTLFVFPRSSTKVAS